MDAQFCADMAAAEIAVASPTKRDRAKAAAWLALKARLAPPVPTPVPPTPGRITHGSQITAGLVGIANAGLVESALAAYAGPMTLTSPTTITGKKITGRLIAQAQVTLVNCILDAGGDFWCLRADDNAADVTATNCVFRNYQTQPFYLDASNASNGRFQGIRCDISGGPDGGIIGKNGRLTECYIHDLAGDSSSHYDGINGDGMTGWEIRRCKIINPHNQTSAASLGYPNNTSAGVFADNWLAGGGYTMYLGPGTGSGLVITGNIFDAAGLTAIEGGSLPQYGHVTGGTSSGITWSNNQARVMVGGVPTLKTLAADGSVAA